MRLLPALVVAAGIAAMLWAGNSELTQWGPPNAANDSYNLLLQGFRSGQLGLKRETPPELAVLRNPYDPAQNGDLQIRYALHDLSYFRGRLYLYFGVSPVVLLFWPWALLTEDYLSERAAVAGFCLVGFLVSARLLAAVRRRYFPSAGTGTLAAATAALAFASGLPILLQRGGMWEVAVGCAYALAMLTLAFVWRAIHRPRGRLFYVAAASLGCGLIVGARPSMIGVAAVVLFPVFLSLRPPSLENAGGKPRLLLTAAAAAPFAAVLTALMIYNQRRFGAAFEFGQTYQLNLDPPHSPGIFSLRYLTTNFRGYVFGPSRWGRAFPFIAPANPPSFPSGYAGFENLFAVPLNIPVVGMVLALPLAGVRPGGARWSRPLGCFLGAVIWVGLAGFVPLGLFQGAVDRYELDFLPAVMLLASVGILAAEQRLVDSRPAARWSARALWGPVLAASIAFNGCASLDKFAAVRNEVGGALMAASQFAQAARQFEWALVAKPGLGEARNALGICYARQRDLPRALAQFETAVQLMPASAQVHRNFGFALADSGRWAEAAEQYRAALKLDQGDRDALQALNEAQRHLSARSHSLP